MSEVQKDIGQMRQDLVLSNKFTVLLPTPSTDSISGTYAIGSDGSGSITHPEGTDPIFVSADASLFLMGQRQYNPAAPYAWVSMAVGVKKTSARQAAPWIQLLLEN
jgi:hypothetical protein